jgi:integrase
MSASAWIYQDDKQVKKHGEAAASWYDPDGRRCCKSYGPGREGKRLAEKERRRIEAELMTGTYRMESHKPWEDFRAEYKAKVLEARAPRTKGESCTALDHFERIVKPVRVFGLGASHIDGYIATRRLEKGAGDGPVSPATINKELRHIRAALRKAFRWGYLPRVPEIEFLKEPKKLPTYMPPEHFAAVYRVCDKAKFPNDQPYPAADWWRALLMTAYLTGWRIGSLLALRRDDVDLEAGKAVSLAEHNKGKRDQAVLLHPVAVEHLKKLAGFDPHVFPWNHRRATVFAEFRRLQDLAAVKPAGKSHYGFHDIRRAFATMNADRLTLDALQALMQHKDYKTTQRYINIARQLSPAVENLFVPDMRAAMEG